MWEVEGHLLDTRSDDVTLRVTQRVLPAGEALHEMWVRLTIDDNMTVVAVEASMDATPNHVCGGAVSPMQTLVGLRIKAGWTNEVRVRLGGPRGCTHLMELMGPVATTALQAMSELRIARDTAPPATGKPPAKIDSCFAYAANRDVVKKFWPEFYSGGV
jgi:hypothetical protein